MNADVRTRSMRHRAALLAAAVGGVVGCANVDDRAPGTPDGPRGHDIAYVARSGTNHDIFLLRAGEAEPVNLTDHPASDYWLGWSPAGDRIAFGTKRDGNHEIYLMAPDGSDLVNLTRNPASDKAPAWSPDGSTIAFHSDRDHARGEIYLMDADGSNVRRLTHNEEYEECAEWSPDGRSIAYCRLMPDADPHGGKSGANNGEIYVMDRDGGNPRRLTDQPGFDSAPAWSPDGTRIAFHGASEDRTTIYVIGIDGTGLVDIGGDEREHWQPSWTPDGEEIAYCAGVPPHEYDIWIMRADGSHKRPLTTRPGREESPHVRPGRR